LRLSIIVEAECDFTTDVGKLRAAAGEPRRMYDRRQMHASASSSAANHGPSTGASPPGKHTLTERLASDPVASAAGRLDRRSALRTLQSRLDDPLNQVGDTVRDKVVDKVTDSIEKLVNKLIDDLDKLAQKTIDDGLKAASKECPTQAQVQLIEQAIDSRRMTAAFHMLKDVDKAVKAAIDSLQGDGSAEDKTKQFEKAIEAMIKALKHFADEIHKTNREHHRLATIVARCPKQPKLNQGLQAFTVPQPLEKLPHTIKVPPSIDPPAPDHLIAVPSALIL
jgi:uncharacterized protein YukE